MDKLQYPKVAKQTMKLAFISLFCLIASAPSWGESARDHSCFARMLPENIRVNRLDDVKHLLGWVFDINAAHKGLLPGEIIDSHSGLKDVPGFGGATDLSGVAGRYRVMRAPFDSGNGYYGVELGALESNGKVSSLFLLNRLFRLPVLLQQPAGVATDIVTNVAMFAGWRTQAITDANNAAAVVLSDAERLTVPFLTVGQSQAEGVAQLQAAYLAAANPKRLVATGFITFNAAYVVSSVKHYGVSPDAVEGINFVKDLDPGFGPHGLLPNRIGLQVYIHPDGTASSTPGSETFFAAWLHPAQHILSAFFKGSLTNALATVLHDSAARCSAIRSI